MLCEIQLNYYNLPEEDRDVRAVPKPIAEAIYSLCNEQEIVDVLEIGLGQGMSSLPALQAGCEVVSIDPYQDTRGFSGKERIESSGIGDNFHLIEEDSHLALPKMIGEDYQFDLIIVDADPSFQGRFIDCYFAHRLLKPGGYLLIDDLQFPSVPKTIQFLANTYDYKWVSSFGRMAVLNKPSKVVVGESIWLADPFESEVDPPSSDSICWVIPAHNEGERLKWCLGNILRVKESRDEVRVVFDGSQDSTYDSKDYGLDSRNFVFGSQHLYEPGKGNLWWKRLIIEFLKTDCQVLIKLDTDTKINRRPRLNLWPTDSGYCGDVHGYPSGGCILLNRECCEKILNIIDDWHFKDVTEWSRLLNPERGVCSFSLNYERHGLINEDKLISVLATRTGNPGKQFGDSMSIVYRPEDLVEGPDDWAVHPIKDTPTPRYQVSYRELSPSSGPKVIGIGLPRTGTTSLNHQLYLFGKACVHWPIDSTTIREIQSGDLNLTELRKCDGITDGIGSIYYEDFDCLFPDSKFVLTTRDKGKWLASCKRIWEAYSNNLTTMQSIVRLALFGCLEFNERRFSQVWNSFNRNVINYFSDKPDKLLVVDVSKDQPKELHRFLGIENSFDETYTSYPHLNELPTQVIQRQVSSDPLSRIKDTGIAKMLFGEGVLNA